MSKSRIFGQQIEIFFSKDGNNIERIGEIDNFSYKSKDVVKENTSLGEGGIGSIDVLDNGGTLSFEAKSSGAEIVAMFMLMKNHYRADGQAGKRGRSPYFEVRKVTTLDDDSTITLKFHGLVLHDDEASVGGSKEEDQEKFQGTYKKATIETSGGHASEDVVKAFSIVSTAIANFENLQGATVTDQDGYKERSIIAYLLGQG